MAYLCANINASAPVESIVWSGPCIISYSLDSSCIVVGCAGDYIATVTLDGGCSGTDTASVVDLSVPSSCSIDPAGPYCPSTTNQHCGPVGQSSYQWSITGNGSIQGSATSQCVSVLAGATCGSYTLELIVGENQCADTCDMTFLIEDTIAPVLDPAPANATYQCSADVPAAGSLAWTDNCDGSGTVLGSDVSNGQTCPEIITRTWTYTDACGNTASATQTITVNDTIAPVLDPAPANATYQCINDVPAAGSLGWTDNCDGSGSVLGDRNREVKSKSV
jgi:hypothetical protein